MRVCQDDLTNIVQSTSIFTKIIYDNLVHIHTVGFRENKLCFILLHNKKNKSTMMLEMPKHGMSRLEHFGINEPM